MLTAHVGEAGGYAARSYALSLGTDDRILALPRCAGFLVVNPIIDGLRDLSAAYPLFACTNWAGLASDIGELSSDFVSATIVTDPFLPLSSGDLGAAFDVVRPLHRHAIVDLDEISTKGPSRHHKRKLRTVARGGAPRIQREGLDAKTLDGWVSLYETLVRRKQIRDMRAFSRGIFERQFGVPGATIFSAWEGDELLGMDWYFQDGDRVYAHLSAYSEAGYQRAVSYPLMEAAIEHFRPNAAVLTLGGVPAGQEDGGLAYFKAGWATRTLPTYLCGVVLNEREFRRLNGQVEPTADGFFPHYRRGQFGVSD